MVKVKRISAFFIATLMVVSALVVMMPSALAAVDGTAFYDEDYSGTAADYWIDIVDPANSLGGGDENEYHIDYPFSMYGDSFTEVTVGDNGAIRMGYQTTVSLSNYNFPTSSSSHTFEIAVFQDDLDAGNIPSPAQDVYAKVDGTKLIVTWYHVHRYTTYGDYTFQAILDNDDSSIRFNYLDMNPDLYSGGPEFYDSPTVGLNKGDGLEYEEYLYDSGYSTAREGNYPVTGTTILYYIGAPPPMGVFIDGPDEVDEGTLTNFLGTIAGYGVASGIPGYSMDDTGIEPYIDASGGTDLIPLLEGESSTSILLDDGAAEVPLPFPFEFYGMEYPAGHMISVCVNGFLDFGCVDHWDEYNDNIPTTGTYSPNNAIYPFWDDLRFPTTGGGLYMDVGISGGHAYMVIEWKNVGHFDSSSADDTRGRVDFEVILWDNNIIEFRYDDVVFEYTPEWDRNDWHRYSSTSYDPPGSTGNYAMVYYYPTENQDETLISPDFSVSGYDPVTLSWNNHFDDDTAVDAGYVDVSFNGGTSWTNVVTYGGSDESGSESYSISTGGSSTMMVRFHYVGYNGYYWSIDDIEVSSGSTILFTEDFDGPGSLPNPWDNNDWHNYYYSTWGSNTARVYFSPIEDQDEELISPSIDVSAYAGSSVDLEYKTYYNDYTGTTDAGYVDVSFDGGAWTPVVTYLADTTNPQYESFSISVPSGASTMMVRFQYVGNNDWYWYIDDVEISSGAVQLLFEDFESSWDSENPPAGWTIIDNAPVLWGQYGENPPLGWTIYDDGTSTSSYSADNGDSATVGIENIDGTEAEKYKYGSSSSYPDILPGMNIKYTWHYFSGTGYQWIADGEVVENGPVTADPFYTSISQTYPDGPSTSTLKLEVTYDGIPIDSTSQYVTVNNAAPVITDYSSPTTVDLGEDSWIHGYVDDVPADTFTVAVEVSGTSGEDWIMSPHETTVYEYSQDIYAIRPGTYTVTIAVEDDEGASDSLSFDITFVVPAGALKIVDIFALPEDLQAGGMTMIYIDVLNTFGIGNWHQLEDGEWWCGDEDLGTYDNSWLDALIFEDIDVEADGALRINHYIESEGTYDGGNVQISTDDGTTWTLLYPVDGYDDTSIYGLDSPATDSPGFTSYTGYSAEDIFDLSAYAGSTVDIRFVFGSDSSVSTYDGWTLYSVEVGTMETAVIPGSGWTQLIHSGTGVWEWVSYSDGRYTDPPGTGTYYIIADSDENTADVYNVGVFSPSMDMTGETSVTVTYARDFQEFAGDGYMEVNTYSGGTFQETLFSQDTDDPIGGLTDSHTFNPSTYTDPSDVQIEFIYSTEGGTYAWGFGLDDMEVTGGSGVIFSEDFETTPFDMVGPIFTAISDITDSGSAENLIPSVYVELPLAKEDLVLDVPDGWSVLAIDGPGYLGSTETASLVAALSIPPGTPIGEYNIDFDIPYVSMDWSGDLGAGYATEHYIDDIGFDFPFYPNAVPTPPQPGDVWWCGDDATGLYSPNAQDSLVFQVTLAAGEQLAIEHDLDGFNTWDGGNLQVWDGTNWQLVYPDSGYLYDDTNISGLDSPFENAAGWSESNGPKTSYFDLGAGTHDVRLVFGSTSVVEYRGWLIYSVLAGTTDITDTGVPTNLNPGPSEWHQVAEPPSGGGGPYGGTFRDITISSEGTIAMGEDTSISTTNYQYPSTTSSAHYMISPYWDYLDARPRGSVSYNNDGSRAIITWYDIPYYLYPPGTGTYSFQCILYPNGDIQFNYLTMQEGTSDDSGTVGINLGDGINGTTYWYESSSIEVGTRPTDSTSVLFTYDGQQYVASEIPFEWFDFSPRITVNVVDKMTANDLAFYRHTQNAMKNIVMLYMNIENGMEDDGSLDSALEDYHNCAVQEAHSTATCANAHGEGYGYWVNEGGMGYFLNPGKNGNGMAGLTGSAAKD